MDTLKLKTVVGMDIGKKESYLKAIEPRTGIVFREGYVDNSEESLRDFFGDLPCPARLVMEATGNFSHLHDLLERDVANIQVAHPLKVKAIASAKIKTDKIDAGILAHLGAANLVPEAYCPPREVRDLREVLRHRAFLVALRTRIKNRIHGSLWKLGISTPERTDLFANTGLAWLEHLEIPAPHDGILKQDLRLLEVLNKEIGRATKTLEGLAQEDPRVAWLEPIRGVGAHTAMLVLAEIGDINRFPEAKKLVAYAGLCPSTYQSGRRSYHGALIQQGSKWLRWSLVEAAQRYAKVPGRLGDLFRRIARKKGTKTARVAVAREMLTGIYHCLKREEPYRETPQPMKPIWVRHAPKCSGR